MRLKVRITTWPAGAVIVVTHADVCTCVPADVGEGSMMMPVELVNVWLSHTLVMDVLNVHVASQLGATVVDGVEKLLQ